MKTHTYTLKHITKKMSAQQNLKINATLSYLNAKNLKQTYLTVVPSPKPLYVS